MNQLSKDQWHPTGPSRVAFVQACWHKSIVDRLYDAFAIDFSKLCPEMEVDRYEVPGSFEIPLHAKKLALTGRYSAIVAAGFVVNGGIYRHDFVASTVISALMQVQLEVGVPVFSAVLTPLNFHEHDTHQQFFGEHFVVKGREAAEACSKTLKGLERIKALASQAA